MTYCWADVHQRLSRKVDPMLCRARSHIDNIVCDAPYKGRDDVRCITEAGRHDRCMGPNGPAWPHPAACDCVEVRRVLENPGRRNVTRAASDPAQRRLP